MTAPLIDSDDLGTYLGDDSIDEARAEMIILYAQQACEDVVNPIPAAKVYVLMRVAIRAYVSSPSRGYQLSQADAQFPGSTPVSGVYLTAQDRADLLGDQDGAPGSGSAFTIHTRPRVECVPEGYPGYPAPLYGGRRW